MITQRLAIYDMDRTITHLPTWTPFLLAAARTLAPWRLTLLPLAGLAGLAYTARLIDRAKLKQWTQAMLLGRVIAAQDAERVADDFAQRIVAEGVFAGARAQIAADRAAGYRLVMATASYRFYAGAIARQLGFDDTIGTETATGAENAIVARIAGENCYGPVKLKMIEDWMSAQDIQRSESHIRFYSDHVSDAPVLGWADEGFAVNAHGPLRALARKRGWTVLDWER